MKRTFLWGGLIGFAVFFLIGLLTSTSNNGPSILPLTCDSKGLIWVLFALVGAVFFLIGLVMVIVDVIKRRK